MAETVQILVNVNDAKALAALNNLQAAVDKLNKGVNININAGGTQGGKGGVAGATQGVVELGKAVQGVSGNLTLLKSSISGMAGKGADDFSRVTQAVQIFGDALGGKIKNLQNYDKETGKLVSTAREVTYNYEQQQKAVNKFNKELKTTEIQSERVTTKSATLSTNLTNMSNNIANISGKYKDGHFSAVSKSISDIQTRLTQLNTDYKDGKIALEEYNSGVTKCATEVSKLGTSFSKAKGDVKAYKEVTSKYWNSVTEAQAKLKAQQDQMVADAATKKVNQICGIPEESEIQKRSAAWKEYFNELGKVGTQSEQVAAKSATLSTNLTNMSNRIAKISGKYQDGHFSALSKSISDVQARLTQLNTDYKSGKITLDEYKGGVAKCTTEVSKLGTSFAEAKGNVAAYKTEVKTVSKIQSILGDSLGNIVVKMAAWQIVGTMVATAIRSVKDAVATLKEVDTQLTNIKKVTDMTDEQLSAIGERSYDTAKKYGADVKDYVASVYEFTKAGLGENAEQMAELAMLTQNVGDTTQDTATKFLVAANAAWKMNGSYEELMTTIDKADYINNNYATDIEKLAEGLPIVASTAANVGLSVDQTLAALGTITSVTQESGTKAATALRAIILNLFGTVNAEITDGVTTTQESVSLMSKVMRTYAEDALTAARASGSIVDPMIAINAIAQAAEEGMLTEAELFQLLGEEAGKLRVNQLTALVKNQNTYNEMLEGMTGASGLALKENELMLSSWEKKTQNLKTTWEEFVAKLIDTDMIKSGIDAITHAVEFLDSALEALEPIIRFVNEALGAFFEELSSIADRLSTIVNTISKITKTGLKQAILDELHGTSSTSSKSTVGIPLATYASGTRYAPGGKALVNERGPELISDNGKAYIANGGRPAIVNLGKGASVLTAGQTAQALHGGNYSAPMKAYADGYITEDGGVVDGSILSKAKTIYDSLLERATAEAKKEIAYWTGTTKSSSKMYITEDGGVLDASYTPSYLRTSPFSLPSKSFTEQESEIEAKRTELVNKAASSIRTATKTTEDLNNYINDLYDYADDVTDYYESISEAVEETVEEIVDPVLELKNTVNATLSNLDKQIKLAENQGDTEKAIELRASAVEYIKESIEQFKALGLSDLSDEVLDLENEIYNYLEEEVDPVEELANNINETLTNLDKQIQLAEKQGDTAKVEKLQAQVRELIASYIQAYKDLGFDELSNEILDLESKVYDYVTEQIDPVEELRDEISDTISNLEKQIRLAENQGNTAKVKELQEQAKKLIEGYIEDYKELGFDELSDEILDLENALFDYVIDPIAELTETLEDALSSLNEQIQYSERAGNTQKLTGLRENALKLINEYEKAFRALGLDDASSEIISLQNQRLDILDAVNSEAEETVSTLIDALNGVRNATEESNELQDKQNAIEEARLAVEEAQLDIQQATLDLNKAEISLRNAQKQRTVRTYNSATGQWEWIADESAVSQAKENRINAQNNLDSAKKTLEAKYEELAERQEEYVEYHRAKLWEALIDDVENADIGSIAGIVLGSALASEIKGSGSASEVLSALGAITGAAQTISTMSQIANNTSDSHNTNYYYNGVQISSTAASTMTIADLTKQLQSLKVG